MYLVIVTSYKQLALAVQAGLSWPSYCQLLLAVWLVLAM